MTDMTPAMGHNNPPDPIDEALAPFGDVISEAENWLDGSPVETEAQMKAADDLIKGVKAAKKAVDDARDTVTKPLHEAWKGEVARWKPTQDDLDRIIKGLVAMVDGFKRKLAAEKAEAERLAREAEAEKLRQSQEAAEAARENPADLEAQRAAATAAHDAEQARIRAAQASKDTVKGLRLTWFHEVTDTSALLRWINRHDRAALDAFCEEYARAHRTDGIARDGMRAWQERVAA